MWEEINDLKGVLEVNNKTYKTLGKIDFSAISFPEEYIVKEDFTPTNISTQIRPAIFENIDFTNIRIDSVLEKKKLPIFKNINNTPISSYYENVLEKNRQLKMSIPKLNETITEVTIHEGVSFEESNQSVDKVENDITSLIAKKNKFAMEISLIEPNETEKALVKKRDWIDILFSDVDVIGAIKRFCKRLP